MSGSNVLTVPSGLVIRPSPRFGLRPIFAVLYEQAEYRPTLLCSPSTDRSLGGVKP